MLAPLLQLRFRAGSATMTAVPAHVGLRNSRAPARTHAFLSGEMPAPAQLKRSWWQGSGASIVIHALVLGALIYAYAHAQRDRQGPADREARLHLPRSRQAGSGRWWRRAPEGSRAAAKGRDQGREGARSRCPSQPADVAHAADDGPIRPRRRSSRCPATLATHSTVAASAPAEAAGNGHRHGHRFGRRPRHRWRIRRRRLSARQRRHDRRSSSEK